MDDQHRLDATLEWTHEGTVRRQLEAGLRMTPAERLRWLEEMLDELLPLVGRARELAPTAIPDPD